MYKDVKFLIGKYHMFDFGNFFARYDTSGKLRQFGIYAVRLNWAWAVAGLNCFNRVFELFKSFLRCNKFVEIAAFSKHENSGLGDYVSRKEYAVSFI